MNKIKSMANTNTKLAPLHNRRTFLIKCRKHNIIPQHISHGMKNVVDITAAAIVKTLHHTAQFNNRLRNNILNLEIKITHDSIHILERAAISIEADIDNLIPYNMATNFHSKQSIAFNKHFSQIRNANIVKFNKLKQQSLLKIKTPPDWLKIYQN
ncbi:hypothetical protein JTB14_006355 [Gonioctena quinquepunctata]|nr:hypothetical protein JTB14_006355 [Gonioctena quinquepunctata]